MKRIGTILSVLMLTLSASAQELNCQVSVINDPTLDVTSVELEIFKQLEETVFDIMNSRKWTNDNFEVEERINCQLQFQIREIPAPNSFSGYLQVQSSRPSFNSSYNTVLFNYQDDDLAFSYSRGAVLNFSDNQFRDNLTSILAFYAYYIIGMDYDSFSNQGGTKYFQKAQDVVAMAQTASAPGWRSNETGKRNRYWLVDNALHELFSPLRECNYEYHRKGIDMLYDNKEEGRKNIYNALNKLVKVVSTRPNSLNLLNFIQAKTNELKNLYEDAEVKEKTKIVNLLKRLDPANSSRYQEILG
jgi:hypothetical protein